MAASTGFYQSHTALLNSDTFFKCPYGIDNEDFFKFNPVRELEKNREALATLNDGKNIITTNVLAGKLGLKVGDTLLLQFGSREVSYTIISFVETNVGIGPWAISHQRITGRIWASPITTSPTSWPMMMPTTGPICHD